MFVRLSMPTWPNFLAWWMPPFNSQWSCKISRVVNHDVLLIPQSFKIRESSWGCGTGLFSKFLSDAENIKIIGVDLSEGHLQLARQHMEVPGTAGWKIGLPWSLGKSRNWGPRPLTLGCNANNSNSSETTFWQRAMPFITFYNPLYSNIYYILISDSWTLVYCTIYDIYIYIYMCGMQKQSLLRSSTRTSLT